MATPTPTTDTKEVVEEKLIEVKPSVQEVAAVLLLNQDDEEIPKSDKAETPTPNETNLDAKSEAETKGHEQINLPPNVEAQKIDDSAPVPQVAVDDQKTYVEKDSLDEHSKIEVAAEVPFAVEEVEIKDIDQAETLPVVEAQKTDINVSVTQVTVDDDKMDVEKNSIDDAAFENKSMKQPMEESLVKESEGPSAEEKSVEATEKPAMEVLPTVRERKDEVNGAYEKTIAAATNGTNDESNDVAIESFLVEKTDSLAPQIEAKTEEQSQVTGKVETLSTEVKKPPAYSVVKVPAEVEAKSEAPSEQPKDKDVHVNPLTEVMMDQTKKNEGKSTDPVEDLTKMKEDTTCNEEGSSETRITTAAPAGVDKKEDVAKPTTEAIYEDGGKFVVTTDEESKTQPLEEVSEKKPVEENNTGKDVEEPIQDTNASSLPESAAESKGGEIAKDEKPETDEYAEEKLVTEETAVKETAEEIAKTDVHENEEQDNGPKQTTETECDNEGKSVAVTEELNTHPIEEVDEKRSSGENGTAKDVEEPARDVLKLSDVMEKTQSKDETVENKNRDIAKDEKPVKDENAAEKADENKTAVKPLPESELEVKYKEKLEGIAKEVPAVKPTEKQSNNILSKVKKSLVKAKKAIIGKSPSSKTLSPETKGDTKVN